MHERTATIRAVSPLLGFPNLFIFRLFISSLIFYFMFNTVSAVVIKYIYNTGLEKRWDGEVVELAVELEAAL